MVDANLERKALGQELQRDLREWQTVLQSKEWKKVIQYLETRFLEIDEEDCSSLKDLAKRTARLDEIKRLFRFIRHDYDSKAARLRQLLEERQIDGEDDPVPFMPY